MLLLNMIKFSEFTGPYWPSFYGLTRPYWVILDLSGSNWTILGLTGPYRAFLGLTWTYHTGPYRALLGLGRAY